MTSSSELSSDKSAVMSSDDNWLRNLSKDPDEMNIFTLLTAG